MLNKRRPKYEFLGIRGGRTEPQAAKVEFGLENDQHESLLTDIRSIVSLIILKVRLLQELANLTEAFD